MDKTAKDAEKEGKGRRISGLIGFSSLYFTPFTFVQTRRDIG